MGEPGLAMFLRRVAKIEAQAAALRPPSRGQWEATAATAYEQGTASIEQVAYCQADVIESARAGYVAAAPLLVARERAGWSEYEVCRRAMWYPPGDELPPEVIHGLELRFWSASSPLEDYLKRFRRTPNKEFQAVYWRMHDATWCAIVGDSRAMPMRNRIWAEQDGIWQLSDEVIEASQATTVGMSMAAELLSPSPWNTRLAYKALERGWIPPNSPPPAHPEWNTNVTYFDLARALELLIEDDPTLAMSGQNRSD